jgi:hypothetical protein
MRPGLERLFDSQAVRAAQVAKGRSAKRNEDEFSSDPLVFGKNFLSQPAPIQRSTAHHTAAPPGSPVMANGRKTPKIALAIFHQNGRLAG